MKLINNIDTASVSYTHLDVYKRQFRRQTIKDDQKEYIMERRPDGRRKRGRLRRSRNVDVKKRWQLEGHRIMIGVTG